MSHHRHIPKLLYTPNIDKYYSCQRKVQHQTQADAEGAVKMMRKKRGVRGLEVYKCRYCNFFHVGHPIKEK